MLFDPLVSPVPVSSKRRRSDLKVFKAPATVPIRRQSHGGREMRSLSVLFVVSVFVLFMPVPMQAHDVTVSGTNAFAALDGSSSDHDGVTNGVFTVDDGDLVVNGVVQCNDVGPGSNSACAMAFNVSGNLTINAGGALYAENRSGSGNGGAISFTVGGDLVLNGNALVSSAATSGGGSNGGTITATVSGAVTLSTGSTIDAGGANGDAGNISIVSGGGVVLDGNVLSGPSRSLLATRLTGAVLGGGNGNQSGGHITISSSTFAEPAISIGAAANIVSQSRLGSGSVTLDGCGIDVHGLVASVTDKDTGGVVVIRSGKDLSIDGRDLGATGTRMGRVRADSLGATAGDNRIDLFAAETISMSGPSGALFVITANPLSGNNVEGGEVRVVSTGDAVSASGNAIDAGRSSNGSGGGTISLAAGADVDLDSAVLRAVGSSGGSSSGHGGSITIRSHSGNVLWTNGTGDVRPVGSASGLPLAAQGTIALTACGMVDTAGSSFPVDGTATGMHPETQTGICAPANPSLPDGVPPLVTCNTPPVANDASVTSNEDTTVTITLSGSDSDGDPLTFSIVSGSSNGSLGAIVQTTPTSATVDYTPDLDYNGADSFVYQVDDGNGGTDNATISIIIVPVNDPPSFLAGPTEISLEDAGPQSVSPWATAMSAGPADESGQTVAFVVSNDNPGLFLVQPSVDSNGTLTYTANPNANGSANLTIYAQDTGGTANGGDDTSDPQSSAINVTPVNDAPSFTRGPDQAVTEDAGPQSVSPWATGISAGENESTQTVTFVVTNSNNALFSVQPAVAADGTLTYTPAADANGTAVVTVTATDDGGTANGGVDTSAAQTFNITVSSVNDAPSFTGGGDVTVPEDSAAYSAPWATAISAGPANESGQALTFNVTNDNNSLFSVQPSISASGVLSFTLNANFYGSATVTVTLSDDGGTANGGVDTSAALTFTINVTPVNDAPGFDGGGDVTVNEDSGPYTAPWATGITAGPNETQTVTFSVSNNNDALFLVQPSISPDGVLSFTPAPNAFGSAAVTVALTDDGGTANGGVDTSAAQTFTINVTGVNDGPTAGNDSWETFGNTELRVDLTPALTAAVYDTTPSGNGVRDNDTDPEGDPTIVTGIVGCSDTSAPFDCTLGDGSKVSMLANGSFSYTPGPGNTSGSFQYTATDIPGAGSPIAVTGTVTITIYERIWYVSGGAVPGGNGTSSSPFTGFASLDGAGDVDAPGDTIFVHASSVVGSIGLEANQKLWGEGIGLSMPNNLNGNGSPAVLVAPGVAPVVTAATDTVSVTGVSGVEIAGLTLFSTDGNGIDITSNPLGSPAGVTIYKNRIGGATAEGIDINADSSSTNTVSIAEVVIDSAGNGLDVAVAGVTLAEAGIRSAGRDLHAASVGVAIGEGVESPGNGLEALTVGDLVISVANLTVTSGGTGVKMTASAGGITITGFSNVLVEGNTAGTGIDISGATFDAVPGGTFDTVFAASIAVGSSGNPVGGAGAVLSGVSGDLNIGSLLVDGSTSGVSVTGSDLHTGTTGMRLSTSSGAINAAAGAGLSVTDTTIGSGNLNFTRIDAAGGVNGISLNNTGTTGGLNVIGAGTAGSGGTIHSTTSYGVSLTDTTSPSFSRMIINDTGRSGIFGTGVVNFTLTDSTVSNSGTTANAGDSNIDFENSGVGPENSLSGVVTITGNTLSAAPFHGISIFNRDGIISNAVITGNAITSTSSAAASLGSGIKLIAFGTPTSVAQITRGDISDNQITNFPSGAGLLVQCAQAVAGGPPTACGTAGSGTNRLMIHGNTVSGASATNRMGAEGIVALVNGIGTGNFEITANSVSFTTGTLISHSALGNAVVTSLIENNVVQSNGISGAQGIGVGVGATFGAGDTPSLTTTISNNQTSQTNGSGILAVASGASGTLRIKILGNTIGVPTGVGARYGIRVDSGNSTAGTNNNVCLNIAGNSSAGSGGGTGIGLRKQGPDPAVHVFSVNGMVDTSSPGVETYVDGQNPSGGGTTLLSASTGFSNCSNP